MSSFNDSQLASNRYRTLFKNEEFPVVLAPLAGVSDAPYRLACSREGADLTYVEMLSSVALWRGNQRTLDMLDRLPEEGRVGVQITGPTVDDVKRAVEILNDKNYDTIDINMGCPVAKVVKTGCGSGFLKDPERVYQTVKAARASTDLPLSAKIRIGWDHDSINGCEIAKAIESAGADWLTVHGRTRSDDYSDPVRLERIAEIVTAVSIPVWGNGNLFEPEDTATMSARTGVAGVMISRGSLGDPWVFSRIKKQSLQTCDIKTWLQVVLDHMEGQAKLYAGRPHAALCFRKNALWYLRGWQGAKPFKDEISHCMTLDGMKEIFKRFVDWSEVESRKLASPSSDESGRFFRIPREPALRQQTVAGYDPKWEMNRDHDRGVGHLE